MLESPLDKIEPYGLFKSSLMSTWTMSPPPPPSVKVTEYYLTRNRTPARPTPTLRKPHQNPRSRRARDPPERVCRSRSVRCRSGDGGSRAANQRVTSPMTEEHGDDVTRIAVWSFARCRHGVRGSRYLDRGARWAAVHAATWAM